MVGEAKQDKRDSSLTVSPTLIDPVDKLVTVGNDAGISIGDLQVPDELSKAIVERMVLDHLPQRSGPAVGFAYR
ncbi:hypothetical protein AS850_06035 [Frondihabitans sp. 762G35]|nr:hypothetical protein AS850_06035 [Frondihabitans sp. 762G35]